MKYLLAILSVITAVLAQVMIKNASLNSLFERRWIIFMLLSISAYGITFFLQSYILRFFPLTKIAPATAIAIMILVFGCGIFIFGENITFRQAIGVILGVVSIYLILA